VDKAASVACVLKSGRASFEPLLTVILLPLRDGNGCSAGRTLLRLIQSERAPFDRRGTAITALASFAVVGVFCEDGLSHTYPIERLRGCPVHSRLTGHVLNLARRPGGATSPREAAWRPLGSRCWRRVVDLRTGRLVEGVRRARGKRPSDQNGRPGRMG